MGERTRWWCVATLAAALALTGGIGCGGGPDEAEAGDESAEEWADEEGAEGDEWADEEGAMDEEGGMMDDEGGMAADADPNTISVWVGWQGDGDERAAVVTVNTPDPQTLATGADVSDELINMLKDRKGAIEADGGTPTVQISAPTDVSFDGVVSPIMQASFRAGFGIDYVQYQPRRPGE